LISRRKLLCGTGTALLTSALPNPSAHGQETPASAVKALGPATNAQASTEPAYTAWLRTAESLRPQLQEAVQAPVHLVTPVADPALYLRWRMNVTGAAADLENRTFRPGESFILDFEGHHVGYLSFDLLGIGRNIDAPARLHFTFGEVPGDVAEPLHPYKGHLGEGWLPEELVTIDNLPQQVYLPRRYAFRYVKIEVIGTSPDYSAQFKNVRVRAVTSASGVVKPLRANLSPKLQKIDEVSLATLRDCMQTVFEDGPRRDQRLWIGDMRLQALANYETFRNFALVKRCLYLLAAFPRQDGLLPACVFEKPKPTAAGDFLLDYSALFAAMLYDYVKASNDLATGQDLWSVAKRQLEIVGAEVDANGLYLKRSKVRPFIDHERSLERTAAMSGVLLYCYRQTAKLALLLHEQEEAAKLNRTAEKIALAAQAHFYDETQRLYVSGPDRQVSLASQAWLVLAGVGTREMQAAALRNALTDPGVVLPATPYLYHYVVAAMLQCGLQQEALALIETYWGGMVDRGADTFWEVYNPTDSLASPYHDVHINSFCHAWSCTPALLLRSI
jgi:alpha-L-rhamnosidase